MRIGNTDYKLLYLDTNILRELALNNNDMQRKFLQRFFIDNSGYAPCYSIYNVIELKPYNDIYEKFITFFDMIPSLMIFPYKIILEKEHQCAMNGTKFEFTNEMINAFSPAGRLEGHNIRKYFDYMWSNEKLYSINKREVEGLSEVAEVWNNNREEGKLTAEKMSLSNLINDEFYKSQEKATIVKDMKNHDIFLDDSFNVRKYPGCRIMEYSQFSRVYMTNKKITKNDVMDVKLSCVIPYIDAVVTEKFQAEVYKKSKSFIPEIEHLEIYKLKDI